MAEMRYLALGIRSAEDIADDLLQTIQWERLGQVIIDAMLAGTLLQFRCGVGGDQHDARIRRGLLDRRRQLEAVHARHVVVSDYQRNWPQRDLSERLGATVDRDDVIAAGEVAHQAVQDDQDIRLVFDEDDRRIADRLIGHNALLNTSSSAAPHAADFSILSHRAAMGNRTTKYRRNSLSSCVKPGIAGIVWGHTIRGDLRRAARESLVYATYDRNVQGEGIAMTTDEEDLRRVFTSASLGQTAYRTWAQQARRERRFNVARLFEALSAAKQARAEYTFRQLGEVGSTARNVERALAGLEPEAIATGPVTATTALARDLLTRAKNAANENRDLRADEMADLFVCATCGGVREGRTRSWPSWNIAKKRSTSWSREWMKRCWRAGWSRNSPP